MTFDRRKDHDRRREKTKQQQKKQKANKQKNKTKQNKTALHLISYEKVVLLIWNECRPFRSICLKNCNFEVSKAMESPLFPTPKKDAIKNMYLYGSN